jgi:neutral ceramidase
MPAQPRPVTTLGSLSLALSLATTGHAALRIEVTQPPPVAAAPAHELRAGTAQVDITPRPGPPLFGHSLEAARRGQGYRMRLYARAIALEDEQGERIVIVQLDLGGVSGLVHRQVARDTAALGITPGRLLLAATHTHAGPGGIFGAPFYNMWAAGSPGFDPELEAWMAAQVTRGVQEAIADLKPARLSVGTFSASGLSRNRSLDAWAMNPPDAAWDHCAQTDPRVRVIKIEQQISGVYRDAAALATFAVHSTAVSHDADVFHPDLHGVASRVLEAKLRPAGATRRFVAAFLNSAEGDVSPDTDEQGYDEAERLGRRLAEAAQQAYASATPLAAPMAIRVGYREVRLPHAPTSGGPLADEAMLGVGLVAGAEDGRSTLYGQLGVVEGARLRQPSGPHGYKKKALGAIQPLVLKADHFVRVAPFHIVRLGNTLALAAVPGEPTTVLGRHIEHAVRRELGGEVIVVGLAGEYASYWTTRPEYDRQHYEGASTLFGPHAGELVVEQLSTLAHAVLSGSTETYDATRVYEPGPVRNMRGRVRPCAAASWTARRTVPRRSGGRLVELAFEWRGVREAEDCDGGRLPAVSLLCDGTPLAYGDTREDEHLARFEARRQGDDRWTARWIVPAHAGPEKACFIRVDRETGAPLESQRHDVSP